MPVPSIRQRSHIGRIRHRVTSMAISSFDPFLVCAFEADASKSRNTEGRSFSQNSWTTRPRRSRDAFFGCDRSDQSHDANVDLGSPPGGKLQVRAYLREVPSATSVITSPKIQEGQAF